MRRTAQPSRRWRITRLLVAAAVTFTALASRGAPASAGGDSIDTYFEKPGPYGEVVWNDGGPDNCAAGGSPTGAYTFVYPKKLGGSTGTIDHPVVVWGNGTSSATNATCNYRTALTLLASHGIVVVAANTGEAGDGNQMRLGAQLMVQENNNPSSVFYQKLKTDAIGAAGHSQGAVGAINATLNGGGLFKSVLTLSLPDREDLEYYNTWLCNGTCKDVPIPARSAMNNLGAKIFFARGTGLQNSACSLDDWMSDKTAQDWFPTTAGKPYASATLKVDFPPGGSCNYLVPYPHFDLSKGLGYLNAWLQYSLIGHPVANGGFVGTQPKLPLNPFWQNVILSNLA